MAGVAILISKRCRGAVREKVAEIKGRLLAYNVIFGAYCIIIGSIYTPNSDQEQFITSALSDVLAAQQRLLLIGGDLNLVMDATRPQRGNVNRRQKMAERDGASGHLATNTLLPRNTHFSHMPIGPMLD